VRSFLPLPEANLTRLSSLAIAHDEFLQSNPDASAQEIVLVWQFEKYPGFPSSGQNENDYLPKGIDFWSDYDLENCSTALSRSLISARAQLNSSNVVVDTDLAQNNRDRRDYRVLRTRLKYMIGRILPDLCRKPSFWSFETALTLYFIQSQQLVARCSNEQATLSITSNQIRTLQTASNGYLAINMSVFHIQRSRTSGRTMWKSVTMQLMMDTSQ
jgi:hypothetical protein